MPPGRYFLDTSFAIALAVPRDDLHERAVALSHELEKTRARLVTTRAVILEIGNALARRRYRRAAVELLAALESDPAVRIVPLSEKLYREGYELYTARPDKDWGLTDCCSFALMRSLGLVEALTADEHFRQAGFRALLLE